MTKPHDDRLSRDEAAAVWRRAAQLQAQAMKRLEEGSSRVERESGSAETDTDAIEVTEVESIAAEVGIAPEYVQQALAERETARSRDLRISPGIDRWASRMLGDEQRMLDVSRAMNAEPKVVLDAMRRVFRSAAYDLTLEDTLGAEPLRGAILVFRVPKLKSMHDRFAYAMAASGVKDLLVSLRPAPDGATCEVRIRADLLYARKTNLALGVGATGTMGVGGAAVAATLSSLLLAISGAALAAPAVLAGGVLGGATVVGYGAMYRWGLRKAREALEELLRVLDVDLRTEGAFALPSSSDDGRP